MSQGWNEAAAELNAIVASFDEGEVSVDDLFTKLERATAIIEDLEGRLRATQAKVEELAPRIARVADGESAALLPPTSGRTRLRPPGPRRGADGELHLRHWRRRDP